MVGLPNFFGNDHLGATPEIPSVGKDLNKIGFFGMEPPTNSVINQANEMIGGRVAQPSRQQSPDPQGTTVRMINNHSMMIVDSATPMFTSEFMINGGLMVGGLELPALHSLQHHHSMINEWNPMHTLIDSHHGATQ